jgi:hypothetical protein
MIGYKIKPKWSAGLEVGYEHVSYDDIDQSADNYGGSLFTNYRILAQHLCPRRVPDDQLRVLYTGA